MNDVKKMDTRKKIRSEKPARTPARELKMYKYKFERVEVRGFFNPSPVSNYQRKIEENSMKGWKFIQAFAPGLGGYGRPCYFDLIFERKMDDASA